MIRPLLGALIGLLAGAHVATWGMYKDAAHEGFTWPKYLRSYAIGAALGTLLERRAAIDPTRAAGAVVLFGLVYACERVVVELWKTFLRDEDQSKYAIPMQFRLYGRPVRSRPLRWLVGALCVAVVALAALGLARLQGAAPGWPPLATVAMVGSLPGLLVAVGGAWKDAPTEGFEPLKFFRSPLVTLAWALVLAQLTSSYLFVAAAALGYERATVETYKTFFFPNKPRGKFAGKPVLFPEMLTRRYRFAVLYAGIWAAVLSAHALAFAGPRDGLLAARAGDGAASRQAAGPATGGAL